MLGVVLPQAQALPNGYINADAYPGVTVIAPGSSALPTPGQIDDTTVALNAALGNAYAQNKILFFPAGTYYVNDTLRAWTDTGKPTAAAGHLATVPRNHIAMVGSTAGATRPVIKLKPANSDTTFSIAASPKVLLEFKNFKTVPSGQTRFQTEDNDAGYFNTLRNIDLDCSGYAGAIGLYFPQAQDTSIEDVTITATNAHTGIRGLPSAGAVVVNLKVVGGDCGIDLEKVPWSTAGGVTLAGVQLLDQDVVGLKHGGFAPVVLVGFKIKMKGNSNAVVVPDKAGTEKCQVALIDGIIEFNATAPSVAAINNVGGKNIYLRNVYATGQNGTTVNLIKSGSDAVSTCPGSDRHVVEYSYCDPSVDTTPNPKASESIFAPTPGVKSGSAARVFTLDDTVAPPPDLITRHAWLDKPSWEDNATVGASSWARDATNAAHVGADKVIAPGVVPASRLQAMLDAYPKIFLPPGVYLLTGPVTIPANKILFGASRNATRIEPAATWRPTSGTPAIISAANDANSTSYLGELSIGVFVEDGDPGSGYIYTQPQINTIPAHPSDRFLALDWMAGKKSLVHIGAVYNQESTMRARLRTNDHSLLRVRANGGGRWYGAGSRKMYSSDHPAFHILKIEGSAQTPRTQALSIYGLNLEYPGGNDSYVKVVDSENVRIYGAKNEFYFGEWDNPNPVYSQQSKVIDFVSVKNVALYGLGALRNSLDQGGGVRGLVHFSGSTTTNVLAALITPQEDKFPDESWDGPTLAEKIGSSPLLAVGFPNTVSLYKRGVLNDAAMTHTAVHYR